MNKGILSPESESKIAKWLDDAIVLKGPLELIDGPAFKLVISTLDNKYAEKIPEPYKTKIREGLELVMNESDFEEASRKATEYLDTIIDIPYINDETEKLVFRGLHMIIIAVAAKINTKEAA
jgi:hypothetical protein